MGASRPAEHRLPRDVAEPLRLGKPLRDTPPIHPLARRHPTARHHACTEIDRSKRICGDNGGKASLKSSRCNIVARTSSIAIFLVKQSPLNNPSTPPIGVLACFFAALILLAGGGGGGSSTKKRLQDATNDELMSLVRHHSTRLKIVEEEYSKLKQKVCVGGVHCWCRK